MAGMVRVIVVLRNFRGSASIYILLKQKIDIMDKVERVEIYITFLGIFTIVALIGIALLNFAYSIRPESSISENLSFVIIFVVGIIGIIVWYRKYRKIK